MSTHQTVTDGVSNLLENDTAENYLKSIESWFLCYVSHELVDLDRETHQRSADHFKQLKAFLADR